MAGLNGEATGATFDAASNEHVTVAHNAAWDFGTGDFSLMFAMSLASWPGASQFVMGHRGLGAAGDWGLFLPSTTNTLTLYIEGTSSPLGVGITVAGSGWHLYGISQPLGAASPRCTPMARGRHQRHLGPVGREPRRDGHDLYLAARGSPSSYLSATLGHLAVWKGTALSATDWADIWGSVR